MQIQSSVYLSLVWGSFHNLRFSDGSKSTWYIKDHDIIPMNVWLHKIRLMDTDNCTQHGGQDTMLHRSTKCGVRREIWEWTCTRTARIRTTDPSCIPTEWFLHAGFQLLPTQHQAILWFWGLYFYLVHQHRTLSIMEYIDFLYRTRRKTYWDTHRMKIMGNYLELF